PLPRDRRRGRTRVARDPDPAAHHHRPPLGRVAHDAADLRAARRRLPRGRLQGRLRRAARLVPQHRGQPGGPDPGQGPEDDGARPHGDAGGEAGALGDNDAGVARLRLLPGEHRPRDPRGRARTPVGLALVVLVVLATPASAAGPSREAATRAAGWEPDVAAARAYAADRRGRIAFEAIDEQGRESGLHGRWAFPMASVFKVMLLATYLDRPSVAHRSLHHSERRLLVPMIRRSDSVAATRVRDIVGPGAIGRLAHQAGMRSYRYDPVWGLS